MSRNFSSASASGPQSQRGPRSSAGSMFGGAGGAGSRASVSTLQGLTNALRPNSQPNSAAPGLSPAAGGKETMKGLNDRLDKYLSRVRMLEKSNKDLEDQIKEILLKRGATNERDWNAHEKPLADLRKKIREMTMENARLLLRIDNARLAADDFKVKGDSEKAIRHGVEKDVAGLRKIMDDTTLNRLQVESQIESLKEELAFLKKTHEEEVAALREQIRESSVKVEMDSPKGSDLNDVISKIRSQYEKAAQKNREETELWYQSKFDNLKAEVTQNTEAARKERTELNELRRQKQVLEIDLQAIYSLLRSLEDTLNETEGRNARNMSQLNEHLLRLESELGQVRAQMERQAADYQALLNIKMKLEGEIATYRHLLEGLPDEESAGVRTAAEQK
ncbi:keratin, type I cytoskeletal 18-like isoform X2 [Megalops cyprinoides]|uniref:keratin, type I cytoskeletal 18-like isoform X2 n=1 Tax=Megalops cyprinoides TaxID=118141 RepID=UPI00186411D6|nr:keratin, type I cytoskeletal 18-like isoform X2 [Megalops cyprinoides]